MNTLHRSLFPGIPLLAVVLLLLTPGAPAGAQQAYLVRDIQQGEGDIPYDRSVGPFFVLGNKVAFTTGGQVWVSDGTSAGTETLAEICPGCPEPTLLGTHRGLVYWTNTAYNGNHDSPRRLWRSDGTRAGTFALTDIDEVQLNDYQPFAFTSRHLFFTGCLYQNGCALWRTDGTAGGTVKISGPPDEPCAELVTVADRVFFTFSYHPPGELWRTDAAGTTASLVHSFPDQVFPQDLTAVGNRLMFRVAGDDSEVWSSDGTIAGTRQVTELPNAHALGRYDWFLKAAGGRAYFVADDVTHGNEIWRTDGTPAGTVRVTDFGFHAPFGDYTTPSAFEEVGGRLVFVATDGLSEPRLWVNTGSPGSTQPLLGTCAPAPCDFAVRSGLYRAGGRLLFLGQDSQRGTELWSTDGTAAGTRLVRDFCPGTCGASDFLAAVSGAGVAFVTLNADHRSLWISDGTEAGTRLLGIEDSARQSAIHVVKTADGKVFFNARDERGDVLRVSDPRDGSSRIVDRLQSRALGSSFQHLWPLQDRLLFWECGGSQLWQTRGLAQNTAPVTTPPFYCAPYAADLTAATGSLVFLAQNGDQLWRTDGTDAGTLQLTAFQHPRRLANSLVTLGEEAFFVVEDSSTYERQLWRSNGTLPGTGPAFALPGGHSPFAVFSTGQELLLVSSGAGSSALWISDGTAAGTRQLLSGVGDGWIYSSFVRSGGQIFFSASQYSYEQEIWVTNGTAAGTHRVREPARRSHPWGLTAYQGLLYFFSESDDDSGLWRSDGTEAGTYQVHGFLKQGPGNGAASITSFGGALYFAADDGFAGKEVWRSDGTFAGTTLLRDLAPGEAHSGATGFQVVGDRLFFAANDVVHGTELWQSDGTTAGTRLVHDIAPGALSSSPQQLTVTSDRLYFTADDSLTGRELWALPLSAAAGAGCQPSATRLCLGGGRYQAEIAWRDFQGNTGAGQAVPLTADTGYFWFFDPANVEATVKVIDGQGLNGHQWVFYGALSNVEYTLTVTDTQTNLTRRYFNPAGTFASVGDTQGFGPLGAFATAPALAAETRPDAPLLVSEHVDATAAGTVCQPGPRRLCLSGGRFAVEASWKNFQGDTGFGRAVTLTADTGYFWFFDAANVEVVAKIVDGTALNGKHWFFYGALSSVEYRLTVTDLATGKVKVYLNPSGRFASVGDTAAF